MSTGTREDNGFEPLVQTMRRLRDPVSGCPWDLEQTHASLRGSLLEETHELLEALGSGNLPNLIEELGDLMLQVIFHAQIAADAGQFTIRDVIGALNQKLIRRHPHVFGDAHAQTAAEGIGQWETIKAAERVERGEGSKSMLDGVPKSMPALAYANSVLGRARRAGFDWDERDFIFDKIGEELQELSVELAQSPGESQIRIEDEFGDVLFATVGAAVRMGIDPEEALRGANGRFYRRFSHLEQDIRESGQVLDQISTNDKLGLWEKAKAATEVVKYDRLDNLGT